MAAIDACAFHDWASPLALTPYMSDAMAQLVERKGDVRPMTVRSTWLLDHPLGDKQADSYPETGPPGSDPELLVRQLLDERGYERVVLGYHDGLLATAFPLTHVMPHLIRAINDWTAHEWLERDERLAAHILVCSALPEEAAEEIRRVGQDSRFVGIALGINGLGRPFGHPTYHPIFAAAAELDLPIVIQVGCDSAVDTKTLPIAGGIPATWSELDALSFQPLAVHVTSLIVSGIFEEFPNLRVLLVGGGLSWVPGHLWRIDYQFRIMRRVEAPWLRDLPSEYFHRHVWLSTHSLEAPRDSGRLDAVYNAVPGLRSKLVYASGYPNVDGEAPASIAARIPEAWHEQVFETNALDLYRWPSRAADVVTAGARAKEHADG